MKNERIRYFSMFTGVGGFELGIERANDNQKAGRRGQEKNISEQGSGNSSSQSNIGQHSISCVGFSEIDKYANQLLAKRFPNIPNFGDCTKIEADKLPDFDMLCGGFPCQSFSIAGKRRGFEDTRGTMFFHIARILEVKRPKIVFLENVKGLLNHDKGETFKVIIQTLSELGYDVQWMVLNSKFHGVPQNRERVFIIGSLRGQRRPEILPFGGGSTENVEINQMNNPTHSYYRFYGTDGVSNCFRSSNGNKVPKIYAISNSSKRESKWQTENSPAILSRDYKEPKIVKTPLQIRRLTPTECERLQGFPDNWTEGFSDTQRYKMMGNAVTVNVIKAIGEKLIKGDEK